MGKRLYLVTGGAGFIGSHICERLLKDGHSVRVLDNFVSGKEANLESIGGDVELIRGDITDARTVAEAMKGVEIVFHEAALGSVPRSVADPMTTHEVNITGTLNVLLAARDAGVRRVVNASSSSVYGDTEVLPKHEGMMGQPFRLTRSRSWRASITSASSIAFTDSRRLRSDTSTSSGRAKTLNHSTLR